MKNNDPGALAPLSAYRVLDLADASGAFCSRVLADLGADVIKIESPQGDPSRRLPPFAHGTPGLERGLYFKYHNTNKRSITLNLESADGHRLFEQLVASADVVVETFAPGYLERLGLDYARLRLINPRLILASITPFGQTGPYRHYKMPPIVGFAMSGGMKSSGLPEKPPIDAPHPLANQVASVMAGTGIALALFGRGATGEGQHIDISVLEAVIDGVAPWGLPNLTPDGAPDPRLAGRQTGIISGRSTGFPIYPCIDGYVRMWTFTPRQWEALATLLGDPVLKQPEWQNVGYREEHQSMLVGMFRRYTEGRTVAEVFRKGQALGIPVNPVYSPGQVVDDRHIKSRGFFSELDDREIGKALYPGSPFRLSNTALSHRHPAPSLGEHNQDIYCGELKLTEDELAALCANGVV